MSVRLWALKVGEVRALDAGALLLFGARCALRVAPWIPKEAKRPWRSALDLVLAAAAGEAATNATVRAAARALGDSGAVACNVLDGTKDEARGRCMVHATGTLVAVLDATLLVELAARKKAVLDAAKSSASIPAVLAHGGHVRDKPGRDAVTEAATTIWDAIRADIDVVAHAASGRRLTTSKLGALAPLWPSGAPSWVPAERR